MASFHDPDFAELMRQQANAQARTLWEAQQNYNTQAHAQTPSPTRRPRSSRSGPPPASTAPT